MACSLGRCALLLLPLSCLLFALLGHLAFALFFLLLLTFRSGSSGAFGGNLGFALLLYNLLYVVSILGRVSLFASLRLSVMGLPMTRAISALLLLRLLLLLLLHLRLRIGALVGSIVLLPSGVMVLSMADEI